jgi:hypothetical protein
VWHHLSHDDLRASAQELARVVKPTGRVLVIDVGAGAAHGGGFDLGAIAPRFAGVGLEAVESGPFDAGLHGIGQLHYVLARAA